MSWKRRQIIAVGGLFNVGFVPNSTHILVVSHNGCGVFDCSTGERLFRDYGNYWDYLDDETGKVKGFSI